MKKKLISLVLAAVLCIGPASVTALADTNQGDATALSSVTYESGDNAKLDIITGWYRYGSYWYFFDDNGELMTGWQYINKKWYYFNSSGVMLTGWQQISGKWYFFYDSGAMAIGWALAPADDDQNHWFYFDKSGAQVIGWVYDNKKWYYCDEAMYANRMATIDGKRYYFLSNGAMATGWQKLETQSGSNEWFYFKSNGALTTGWIYDGGKWYYCDESMYHDGIASIGSKKYCFSSSGVMLTGWQQCLTTRGTYEWFYFNSDGSMVTGWLKSGGKWYYLNESMAKNGYLYINGKKYIFNSSGVCTNP